MRPKSSQQATPEPAGPGSVRVTSPAAGGVPISVELAAAIRAVGRREGDSDDGLLPRYWELGRLVEERVGSQVASVPAPGRKAGRPGSRGLAKSLGIEVSKLKFALKIFGAFPTPEARARLMALRRPDGTPPTVGVVARLCSPTLKGDREPLIEMACRENWSEDDARDRLKAGRGVDPVAPTGGRKHRPPRSLTLALARWQREADALIRSIEAVSRPEVVAGLLASSDPAEVTIERVVDVRRTVERARVALMARLGLLERIAAGLVRAGPAADQPPGIPATPCVEKPAKQPGRRRQGPRSG